MIKNKTILFSTLFLAWVIIFAHSIIPHNHLNESAEECKSHTNNSSDDSKLGFMPVFSNHNHHTDDHSHCHFNINTTLTKYVDSPNAFLYSTNYISLPVLTQIQPLHNNNNELSLKHLYFDSISHRGPPSFS